MNKKFSELKELIISVTKNILHSIGELWNKTSLAIIFMIIFMFLAPIPIRSNLNIYKNFTMTCSLMDKLKLEIHSVEGNAPNQ